jgi:hypothetical protein
MTPSEFLKELQHLETITSTIVGLGDPGAAPAKVAQEKVRALIVAYEAQADAIEETIGIAVDDAKTALLEDLEALAKAPNPPVSKAKNSQS